MIGIKKEHFWQSAATSDRKIFKKKNPTTTTTPKHMRYHLTNHVLILTTYAALYISEQNTTDI